MKEEEDGEGEEVDERLEEEQLELVGRREGGGSGTKLASFFSKTWKGRKSTMCLVQVRLVSPH